MSGRLNILYVMDHGEMGGVQRFLDSLLKVHNKDQFKIIVLTFKEGSWIQELRDHGLKVYSLDGMGVRKLLSIIPKVLKILKDEEIQLVHSTYSWAHFLMWIPSFLLGLKKIWFHHGPIEHKKWQGYYQLFRADLVLTNSEYMKGVIENTILNAGGIKVLPYGIESAPFEFDKEKRQSTREQLGLDEKDIAIGIIGFIDNWKGQDVFLKAAKEFKNQERIKFYIIGDIRPGKAQERCQEFKNLLLDYQQREELQNVTFTGSLNIKEGILDALDLFVHASTSPEPFGMVILEAMSNGKAIIASKAGGAQEIIDDKETGLLTAPGNEKELVEALSFFIEHPDQRVEFGKKAKEEVLKNYTPQIACQRIEDLYKVILKD